MSFAELKVLENQSNIDTLHLVISHFTYEKSNHREMVVDIQGSGYVYTDPQLHSEEKSYGRADRGPTGFKKFLETHQCNSVCKKLMLPDPKSIA